MHRLVLRGHFEQHDAWRAPNKTIKFAVISSSPDFSAERAELSRSVLLRCRDVARHHGVELLLPVELWWGNLSANDTDVRLQSFLEENAARCVRESAGLAMLLFVGDRYGSVALRGKFEQHEFEELLG